MNGNTHGDIRNGSESSSISESSTVGKCSSTEPTTKDFHFSPLSLESIRQMHSEFSIQRNWNQFHTPRNILLALVGEVGEVAEHFQWRSDADCQVGLPTWTDEQRSALGDELSDVLVYLVRLADRCEIDLGKAVHDKMDKNIKKYPVDKAFGSSKKYNEL